MEKNSLMIFENEQFGRIRTLNVDGTPWFVSADVCTALGISRTAVRRLDDDEKGVRSTHTPGGTQKLTVVNEFGLYNLILGSRKPEAREFKRWITHEVIPSIRKHGAYMTDELLDRIEADKEIISDVTAKMVAERRSHEQTRNALNAALPKVEYYDAFVDERDCTNIRATAKELEIPERVFCKFLMDKKLVYRAPSKNLMPYQKPFNTGLFIVRDYYRHNHKGCYTLFTSKGKDYIRKLWARENSKCA